MNVLRAAVIIVGILDVIFLVAFIIVFALAWRLRPNFNREGLRKSRIPTRYTLQKAVARERWNEVIKRMSTGTSDGLRLAVIEADKVVDDVLKQMGLQGKHMADRLGELRYDEGEYGRVWEAHRLRNDIVHTPSFHLLEKDAREAIAPFETFLRKFDA